MYAPADLPSGQLVLLQQGPYQPAQHLDERQWRDLSLVVPNASFWESLRAVLRLVWSCQQGASA